ncbi:MAG: DUF192 domain-containing protein [Candidatus Omnitrophota bacterium]|jgi:uncharacterized membrane protein (UPF0127 family)|nr:MAG: DUF192 domain-containing protein [Candidatus Omnitrophota bacterium]
MALVNSSRNTVLAENVIIADSLFSRMKGLLGREKLGPNEALMLKPCNAIHTFFMRFSIDCLFMDENNRIVKSIADFAPWHISRPYFKSRFVIELPAGTIAATNTREGDLISF